MRFDNMSQGPDPRDFDEDEEVGEVKFDENDPAPPLEVFKRFVGPLSIAEARLEARELEPEVKALAPYADIETLESLDADFKTGWMKHHDF